MASPAPAMIARSTRGSLTLRTMFSIMRFVSTESQPSGRSTAITSVPVRL